MTKEQKVRIEAAQVAIQAYKRAISNHDGGLEVAIDLLTDLRHLLQQEGANLDHLFATAKMHHQAEQPSGYSGWTNYETWAVNLWINNEEPSYRYWSEQAANQIAAASQRPQVLDKIWNEADAARYYLADQLRVEVEGASPLEGVSVYSDLLTAALSDVDWTEIARAFINSLNE